MTYHAHLEWQGQTTGMAKYDFASACPAKIAQRIASVTRRNDSFVARLTNALRTRSSDGEPDYWHFGECSDGVWVVKMWME